MKMFSFWKKNSHSVFSIPRGVYPFLLSFFLTAGASLSSGSLQAQIKKVIDIVCIQPFELEQSFKFDWRFERPDVRSGTLVVIKVDSSLVRPKNSLEPVLYAGNHTVQRLNHGYESGYVVGIIPGQVDFSKEPVWFGAPNLPERVSKRVIDAELEQAMIANLPLMKVADMQSRTRIKASAAHLNDLLRGQAGDLVLEFSAQDKNLVESWRQPETKQ